MVHPAAIELLETAMDEEIGATSEIAFAHSSSVLIFAWQLRAVRIALEFLVERVIRVEHGHSIRGLKPLCKFSPPVITLCGRNNSPSFVVAVSNTTASVAEYFRLCVSICIGSQTNFFGECKSCA